MIPKDKVQSLIERHKVIEIELSSGSINSKDFKSKSKEYSELNEIIPYAKKYLNYEFEKKEDLKILLMTQKPIKKFCLRQKKNF